jgi:hypothetical protein
MRLGEFIKKLQEIEELRGPHLHVVVYSEPAYSQELALECLLEKIEANVFKGTIVLSGYEEFEKEED